MIYIFTEPGDGYADAVRGILENDGKQCVIIEFDYMLDRHSIAMVSKYGEVDLYIDGARVEGQDTIWMRRINLSAPLADNSQFSPSEQSHIKNVQRAFLQELLFLLEDYNCLNPISQVLRCNQKISLSNRSSAKFSRLPNSIMTNDHIYATEFISEESNDVVFKHFRNNFTTNGPAKEGTSNGIVTKSLLNKFEGSLKKTPVHLQYMINSIAEYRCLVVGSTIFAVDLGWSSAKNGIDWRATQSTLRPSAYTFSRQEKEQILCLHNSFNLGIAVYDVLRSEDGLAIIDCNPEGQWDLLLKADRTSEENPLAEDILIAISNFLSSENQEEVW